MISSLNAAITGLNASRLQVENVMNNIANENTPGYKKRDVNLEELRLLSGNTSGSGVGVTNISRSTNQYMFDNILIETGKSSYYDEMSQLLGDVESIFKETDESGFSHDMDRYFQAVENLRTNPNSEIYKTDLMNQGNILVDTMNRLYDGIETQERVLRDSLGDDVKQVNTLLNEMGKINQELSKLTVPSLELLDKRDQLELKLSEYVDIEVDRTDFDYELRIGGRVALRYGDNIREFTVTEEKLNQTDRFLKDDGITSSLVPPSGGFGVGDSVIYKLDNNAEVIINFGETATIDGVSTTVDATNYIRALVSKINSSDSMKDHVTAYNGQYSTDANGLKTAVQTSDKYLLIESNQGGPEGNYSGRVVFEENNNKDIFQTDTFTNVSAVISATVGDKITVTHNSVAYDFVVENKTYQELADDINSNVNLTGSVEDVGGGNFRIVIESAAPGLANSISIAQPATDLGLLTTSNHTSIAANETTNVANKVAYYRTADQSIDGKNDIHIQLFDEEITMKSGSIKAKIDNLQTDSGKNLFQSYKNNLDQFAKTLSDLASQYIRTSDNEYIFGEMTIDGDKLPNGNDITQNPSYIGNVTASDTRPDGLFTGADVRSLKFNTSVVNYLDQPKLDYLSKMQWKEDISFKDGTQGKLTSAGVLEDVEANSFSEFFQNLKLNISADKENNDFSMDTQKTVVQSLQNSFDQISKVDNDEEMLNLIKFQAAYTANAKMVTVVDEMLQTLLGIR